MRYLFYQSVIHFQEENVSKHIQKAFSSVDSKSAYKTPNITNITDKLRAENKLFSQDNRLKVRLIYDSLPLLLIAFTRCPFNILWSFKNGLSVKNI